MLSDSSTNDTSVEGGNIDGDEWGEWLWSPVGIDLVPEDIFFPLCVEIIGVLPQHIIRNSSLHFCERNGTLIDDGVTWSATPPERVYGLRNWEREREGEAEMPESGKERVGLGLEWAHFWGLQKAVLWAQVYVIVLPLIKKNLGTMLFLAL